MTSSQDYYQPGMAGAGLWNPAGRSLFPPCYGPMSDNFMWLDSSLNDIMDDQADQMMMKQSVSYSKSDDSSDDHHYSSSADDQHFGVISSDYVQTFQHVHKPQVADFNIFDLSDYTLSHDLRPVFNDQKKYTNNNNNNSNISDYFCIQEQLDSTSLESNIISTFAYPSTIQSLTGPDTFDTSNAFDNINIALNWPKMLVSPSPKQELNTTTKYKNNTNNYSMPFWDSWMSNDEFDTLVESQDDSHDHQLQAHHVLVKDQKPSNFVNPTLHQKTYQATYFNNGTSLELPKAASNKDIIAQRLANDSKLLGKKTTMTKRKNSTATTDELNKRPRFETPSSLPTFKVRKEKLGDRITALQQLVSPFGKTDTASVLHEAIEYIKFLHDQVSVLRTPYTQTGTPINQGESKNNGLEGPKHDLKSRGLCLVSISSTFPVAHETTADFWTPAFGGGNNNI